MACRLVDAFVDKARENGPITVMPVKTQIGLQARMVFSAVHVNKASLRVHLILTRPVHDGVVDRIESLTPRSHVHYYRISSPSDIEAIAERIAEAYLVGTQAHLVWS